VAVFKVVVRIYGFVPRIVLASGDVCKARVALKKVARVAGKSDPYRTYSVQNGIVYAFALVAKERID